LATERSVSRDKPFGDVEIVKAASQLGYDPAGRAAQLGVSELEHWEPEHRVPLEKQNPVVWLAQPCCGA
jgi:hypothetical protein